MISKLIAMFLSAVMGFSMLSFPGINGIGDIVSVMLFGLPSSDNSINDSFNEAVPDSEVIRLDLKNGLMKNRIVLILDPSVGLFKKYSLFASEGLKAIGWCTPADLYVVSSVFSSAGDILSECKRLEEHDEILLAVPFTVTKADDALTPDDPFEEYDKPLWDELNPSGSNWWLEAVGARQAWDYLNLLSPVMMGIVDSGVDIAHPDLQGIVSFPDSKEEKRNRPGAHGTHVTGIVAALQNNAEGISGIFPGAKVSYVDWMAAEDQREWNTTIAILFGFVKNVKAGAKVVSFSVGKSSSIEHPKNSLSKSTMMFDGYIHTYAMAALLDRGYDFLVVEAAGNGNSESARMDAVNAGLFAPAFAGYIFTGLHRVSKSDIINRIILVGAAAVINKGKYRMTSFSNVGPEVEICAPGSYVYSCGYPDAYQYMSGTSMATPLVAGIAGLVWSADNSFTGDKVKEILLSTCGAYAEPNTTAEYLGENELVPMPMVNAKLALEKALTLTHPGMTRVSGTAPSRDAAYVLYGEDKYTVLPDGSYDFLVSEAGKELTFIAKDGSPIVAEEPAPADEPDSAGNTEEITTTQPGNQ